MALSTAGRTAAGLSERGDPKEKVTSGEEPGTSQGPSFGTFRCCARAFSSCGERGLLYFAVCGLLTAVASLVAEHGL